MSSLSYSAVMKLSFAVLGVLVLGFGGCKKAEQPSADVPEAVADAVYNNGKIYTVNGAQPWAEAVAVRDGRFLKVGTTEEVGALVGEKTRVIDLEGRFVMPGIIDLHTHPFITPWYGSMNLSLSDPGDPDRILKDLKAYANANPDKEWILAGQWNIGMYPEDAPRKEWLDEIIPDRPVAVLDQSGHTFWVNSKRDGRFLKVGTTEEVGALVGEKTRVIDLEGRFAMPGIIDLHTHPFITPWYGSMNLSLSDPGDPDQILKDLKAYADANPDKEWILAGQWNIGMYPEDAPRKEWLDEIIPNRPVAVLDQSGHTFWVNSKALELGGIDRDTPSSVKSVVVKDSKTGEPTGTLREQAMQRIEIVVPQAGVAEYARTIYEIFEMFLSYGITSQQTAEGTESRSTP